MIIKISGLANGINELEFSGPISEIGLGLPFLNEYKLSLLFDKSQKQIILNAKMNLTAGFECDRCTEEFYKNIITNFQHLYIFGVKPEDFNQEDEVDLSYIPYDADKIDISKDLYDFAYLTLPMKKLCKDECKGFCLDCLVNLNYEDCKCSENKFNPIWDELKKLNDK